MSDRARYPTDPTATLVGIPRKVSHGKRLGDLLCFTVEEAATEHPDRGNEVA